MALPIKAAASCGPASPEEALDLRPVEEGHDAGGEEAERDSRPHGDEDPEGEVTVEEGEAAGDARGGLGHLWLPVARGFR